MARSHYVMDLFYPATDGSDRLRREVLRIEAEDDDMARAEGQRIDSWRKTQFYNIRAIHNSSRNGDKLIYTSQVEEPAASETKSDEAAGSPILQANAPGAAIAEPGASQPLAAKADE